jgi:hypothetical protein
MKCIALAVAGAATVAGLTACSQNAAPSTATRSPQTVTHSATVVDCVQQYHTWRDGGGRDLVTALNAVDSADATRNMQALWATLKKAKPAIKRAARYPIPSCADPKGYLGVLLMHVNAAVGANSASALRAEMKGVPEIDRELTAELERIAV